MKTTVLGLLSLLALYACNSEQEREMPRSESPPQQVNTVDVSAKAPDPESTPTRAAGEPTNVMEFFAALPEKYFVLEGCDREADKDCSKARERYLKQYTEISDIRNGYFKAGCDGGQMCIEMAIFKRPSGKYLVGVFTSGEMLNDFHFLDYTGGQWKDASNEVPEFSTQNWYELPRFGTTMPVFAKKVIEKGEDYEASEKGRELYDLVWKDGKFTKK